MDVRTLSAALLVCLCFGSIHAYGVLLAGIEQWLGAGRTMASLGYAIALAALTAGVYANGRLAALIPARSRLMGCGFIAALGLLIAGGAASAPGLLTGFGVLFGLANGVAYAMSLNLAASAMPGREAQAMGLATAAYGLGAMICAQGFDLALGRLSVSTILLTLAPVMLSACLLGAVLIPGKTPIEASAATRNPQAGARPLGFLWAAYLLAAFAGLLVLAHAPAIAAWRGGGVQGGTVSGVVSLGSIAGGYLGGVIAAKLAGPSSLAIPVLAQAAVLASVPFAAGSLTLVALLTAAGLCYGILIAAVPAEVRRMSGPQGFARSYGKVFTAWGLAGLAGPVMAGYLFDITHGYGAALAVAAALSLCSWLFILGIPR